MALAVLFHPIPVVKRIWPYITVLGLFCGFVLWNGSVVLGEKDQ